MFKVNNEDTRTVPMVLFWCLYCQLWTYFTRCSSDSIVDFEFVFSGWPPSITTVLYSIHDWVIIMIMTFFVVWLTIQKTFSLIYSRDHLFMSEILTIANLRHATSRAWTCAEPEIRLCWMNLCSSDNHDIMMAPLVRRVSTFLWVLQSK